MENKEWNIGHGQKKLGKPARDALTSLELLSEILRDVQVDLIVFTVICISRLSCERGWKGFLCGPSRNLNLTVPLPPFQHPTTTIFNSKEGREREWEDGKERAE
jgi:hypothetical protein